MVLRHFIYVVFFFLHDTFHVRVFFFVLLNIIITLLGAVLQINLL